MGLSQLLVKIDADADADECDESESKCLSYKPDLNQLWFLL